MEATPLARRVAAAAAALAVALAVGGCGGEAGGTEPGQLAGVQLHPLWDGVTPREAARELDVVARSGADVVRIDVGWSSLEQNGKGRIAAGYAGRLDQFLRNARARKLKVIATLHETPCWASRAPSSLRRRCAGAWWERDVNRYPPRLARDYADAAVYVARRWGDQLAALEIWNEPNKAEHLRSTDPVADYARLVRATYKPVKRVAPRLTVLAGSLLLSDGDFLTELYRRGRIAGHYDAISYHPYTDGSDPAVAQTARGAKYSLIAGTNWLHDIMLAGGDEAGILWATEAGASTCAPGSNPGCVSEAEQARQVGNYVRVARGFPFVRAMIIYNLRDKGTNTASIEQSYGIVRTDLSPKPAYRAFKRAAAER
ncbi:MAG: polysaccharide biosynthesis protein PslG [Solirubrobacteraceae bacterium]|jgi:hypothetical protein|nr:polysaccharide biosynthesis protein PslG [Solirubrobacteraceae bacterium]